MSVAFIPCGKVRFEEHRHEQLSRSLQVQKERTSALLNSSKRLCVYIKKKRVEGAAAGVVVVRVSLRLRNDGISGSLRVSREVESAPRQRAMLAVRAKSIVDGIIRS